MGRLAIESAEFCLKLGHFEMGAVVDWAPHSVTPHCSGISSKEGTLLPICFVLEEKSSW